jgi:hypothetical protein
MAALARRLAPPLAAVLVAGVAAAQQRVSLNGEWQLAAELPDAKPVRVQVPAAFETALGVGFDGAARYRRTLPLPPQRVQHVRVEFAAVATHAIVSCNGVQVGEHLGGWTPFRVDVTSLLKWDGTDVLEVRVDEQVGHNTQGFLPVIQPHFGGIWQDVTLCLDDGPVLDRLALHTRFTGEFLRCEVPVLGGGGHKLHVEVRCGRVEERLGALLPVDADGFARGTAPVGDTTYWSPATPVLHALRLRLLDGERELDRIERRIGWRDLGADGTQVLWNGAPFQLRGVLHWGYSPPHLAPPVDPAWWRPQLERYKAMGFNTLKCCLWVPPRCVYELCDELGLAVWQEYPTWHPKLDQAHKAELLAEYAEFFAHDRGHVSVGFRSITCETGRGADLDVVKALFDACKAAVPATLVVDDSSWIGWQRVTDFWDEHPYGNNSWFPGRLGEFAQHIREKGEKPLLLGECIAADTWADRAAWNTKHGAEPLWWRPDCWTAQGPAEQWLLAQTDAATLASLLPQSLDFAMRNRRFQIEQLRLCLPFAGYVVSVARDFGKARMGLDDDFGQPKWSPEQWRWHGDTMLCLDHAWHERALAADRANVRVRVVQPGDRELEGELRVWSDASPRDEVRGAVAVGVRRWRSEPVELKLASPAAQLARVRVHAELSGSHAARAHWDLWTVPPHGPLERRGVEVATALTPDLLDRLEAGARVVLLAGDRPGSPRTQKLWFLKGAPFAPSHPFHRRVPADALLELCSFDLESERVLPWAAWADQLDPIQGFWETHDVPEVRWHLFAADTNVGAGRLLITTWNLDVAQDPSPVRPFVLQALCDHVRDGPAPRRTLRADTVAALRGQLTAKTIPLPAWRFRTDPDDAGRAARWHDPATDAAAAPWRELRAGSHWENQGDDLKHYTGVAWYRVDVAVPADWQGLPARAVFEGVDDSFEAWLDGEPIGAFGDAATKRTIWLERQVAELGTRLRAGATSTLVLRVVDHAGAGGLWKPVFLTTGPAGAGDPLLH